jgi:hypothetical protein
VKDGYRPKTQRIWPPSATPDAVLDAAAGLYIKSECQRLQDDMLDFANGAPFGIGVAAFDGTVKGLIASYLSDADSAYQDLRFASKRTYAAHLKMVEQTVGDRALAKLNGRDFKRWFANWSDEGAHIPRAHARITMVRLILAYGATIISNVECKRLRLEISDMEFQNAGPRESTLTVEHAVAIRQRAREVGRPGIAFGMALQRDLVVRPKDVLGEWLPVSEPGISAVTYNGMKWLYGFDWKELSVDLVLTHRLSKSLRGRTAIANRKTGKTKEYVLSLYPMVMEELCLMAGVSPAELRRDMLPASGPMVIDQATGLPYRETTYRDHWRTIATDAGVPKSVQNRDSRAGGITEAIDAMDGNVEAARHAAGHSHIQTTLRYSRQGDRQTAKVAEFVAAKRRTNDVTNK